MNPSPLPTGRGSAQVLTPAAIGTPVRVGKTRKYRKMLMPSMTIKANGRKLDLRGYFKDLVKAERDGAFPSIPLQVNASHSPDPRFTEGTVSNLIHLIEGPDGDGLYGDIEFADDDGVKLVTKHPQVGVSVSMVENLVRHEDGKDLAWPAALQHVLMTTDPHVRQTGGGWHPIELGRADVTETIDLSGSTYAEIEEEPVTAPTGTTNPPAGDPAPANEDDLVEFRVSPEDAALLTDLLGELRTADDEPPAGDVSGRGSAGTQGAPGGGAGPDGLPTGAPATNLDRQSADGDPDPIELMRGEIDVERSARVELERELHAARAATEISQLGSTGLAPSIIEAARPLLELQRGSGTIELARGDGRRATRIDPTQVIRNVISEVIELSRRGLGVLDLDQEAGMYAGGEAELAERSAKLKALDDMFPTD